MQCYICRYLNGSVALAGEHAIVPSCSVVRTQENPYLLKHISDYDVVIGAVGSAAVSDDGGGDCVCCVGGVDDVADDIGGAADLSGSGGSIAA